MRSLQGQYAQPNAERSDAAGVCLDSQSSDCITNTYSSVPSALTARVIEDEDAFQLLSRPWSQLAALAGAHPFQDFHWANAWMQTIGRSSQCKLRVATVWDGSRLLAVLPLVRRAYRGARLLEWVGARATDYCDLLLDPTFESGPLVLKLWDALTARGDCDVIRLGQVRSDAKVGALFEAAHLRPWVETRERTYSLPIRWRSGDEWLSQRSAHARKEAKYDLRRLSKAGFEFYVWKPGDPYEPLLEALITQKTAWLASKGLGDLLNDPLGTQFLRKCTAAMIDRGTLHLSALRSKEAIAAVHLGLYHRDVLYGYTVAYDSAWASYSPGAVIRDALIMWACDHGVQRVDILRGADDYKLRYQPEPQLLQTYVIPRGVLGRACLSAYRCGLSIRAWKAARRPSGLDLPAPAMAGQCTTPR